MNWRNRLTGLCWVLGAALLGLASVSIPASDGWAQEPAEADEEDATPARRALKQRIRQKIREKRREFLADKLELDEETSDALEAILDEHERLRKQSERAMRRASQTLKKAIELDMSDEELSKRLTALEDAVRVHDGLRMKLIDETREVLEPRQRAKLFVLLPAFNKRVEKMVAEIRKRFERAARERKKKAGD